MAANKKDDPFGSLDLDTDIPAPEPPPKAPGKPKPVVPSTLPGPAAAAARPPGPAVPVPAVPPAGPPSAPPAWKPEPIPSVGKLGRVAAKKASEVCQHFPLEDQAKALLKEELVPGQYLYLLIEKKLYEDAVRFLAHALSKPEAVWWACQCVRMADANPAPEVNAALLAAEQWAKAPDETKRLATLPPAEALEFSTPAGCVALAAFRSAGFYSPSLRAPLMPPNEYLTAQAVTDGLVGAAEEGGGNAAEKYRKFLALGIHVGNGANPGK